MADALDDATLHAGSKKAGFITEIDVDENPDESQPLGDGIGSGNPNSTTGPGIAAGGTSTSGIISQQSSNQVYRVEDATLPLHNACWDICIEWGQGGQITVDSYNGGTGHATQSVAGATNRSVANISGLPTMPGGVGASMNSGSFAQPILALPGTLPIASVKRNIANNLETLDSVKKASFFRSFSSPPTNAVIADTFWHCVCYYFKSGEHSDIERHLFDRLCLNYVALFASVPKERKDLFFSHFPDAAAQAVLYCLYLAYPKSREQFGEAFRKELVHKLSYWFTGIRPQFVSLGHWKLNLGGGDVLKTIMTVRGTETETGPVIEVQPDVENFNNIKPRAPRPLRTLRYSPLIQHFIRLHKFSSTNLVPTLWVAMTEAEEHVKLLSKKHSRLPAKVAEAKKFSQDLLTQYHQADNELRREEQALAIRAKKAQIALAERREEVLRKSPHDFANYLVSLRGLQSGEKQH